ncbi:DUF2779 domain-containing protein [Clostridiaceae bacterium DONG20-135]|uniref:DUF2779 domain-containing protein n=2 Tax=Copranaerobaculum intestinale TaxID=2692629 RepID=A0A6N8U833_9FIRM|nr:DUF2779 domain-containing protein [Copranaerobaculum intestinale]
MYHISDIKKFERCEKYFWLYTHQPVKYSPFVYHNENMTELCKKLLSINEPYFEGQANDEGEKALQAISEYSCLVNARFVYQDLRIKIPFLIKQDDHSFDVYFTYTSCYPKEGEAQSIADHMYVLKQLQIPVHHIYAIHLNAQYVRQGDLDVHELLIIDTYLFNHKNKAHQKIEELVDTCSRNLDEVLVRMREVQQVEHVESKRTTMCTRGLKCPYFEKCFETPSPTSVLNLVQSAGKLEMQEAGIQDMRDVDLAKLEGTRHQYAQIMAAKCFDGIYFDTFAMYSWVHDNIQYPISYLDFEWETYVYPPYDGMKPYDVLTFQYSLHIEKEHGAELEHKQFLGKQDCREAFIQHLLANIPETGTIMVFNMEGAEKLRLMQLSEQFPQYREQLVAVCDRMIDLSLPFSTGNVYLKEMAGMYSLKKLVTIFSDYRYSDLDISYGMDAVKNWRMLAHSDDEQSKEIEQHLFEYCAMDTYAMVLVYHGILDLLNEKSKNLYSSS